MRKLDRLEERGAGAARIGRPLRILHAYNQHRGGGGADNATRGTIELSRSNGVEVEVFTRSSDDLPRNLAGRLEAGLSAIYSRRSVRHFASLLDSFRPDLVHIHEVFPLVSPWIVPQSTRRGIPVLMSCVDYRITCPVVTHLRRGEICTSCTKGREYWALLRNCRDNVAESVTVTLYNSLVRKLRLFHGHVSRFIAPSEFTRQWLLQNTEATPDRVTTISPIVNIPPAPVRDPAAGTYIGFAGRFAPEKGIDVLLAAARQLDIPFRLARNANSLVKIDVPSNVDVVITRNHEELEEFYRGARAVVVPSIWFETFGLVGAEAMSHGVPVVASRIGALENLIEDGVDGLLFEPRNPGDLAARLRLLWNDPAMLRSMGQRARAKAVALWAPERHHEKLMQVYREVLAAVTA
jgi:glycosyltransferase involved in cell wall biosynthesis